MNAVAAVADSAAPDTAAAFVKFMAPGKSRGMERRRLRSTWEVNSACVQFIEENGGGAGVRLKKSKGQKK